MRRPESLIYVLAIAIALGSTGAGRAQADPAQPAVSPSPAALPSSSPSSLPSSGGAKHPIDTQLDGPESRYTSLLLKQLKTWPPKDIDDSAKSENPVRLSCIETPGEPFYVGLEQVMWVDAPLERVAEVLDDMNHYRDLFPDFDDIHVVSRDGNRILTFWEQHIPVFFLPNVKYEVWYLVDGTHPDRRVYRYQLRKRDQIKNNDGMIVLERVGERGGPSRTRFAEFDFFDADWGPLKAIAPARIWKDSVEGLYLSDLAIKLKAENPSWSYERIRKASKSVLERFPVDRVLEKRKRFQP